MGHFIATKSLLQKKEGDYLDKWESNTGFRSFRSAYEELIKQREHDPNISYGNILASDNLMDINLPNFEISKVVNKEGVLSIGGKIFKYSKDFVKIVTDGNEKKIESMDNIQEREPGIFIAKVERITKNTPSGKSQATLHSCALYNPVEVYGISFIEDYTVFTDDVGWIHSTYTMAVASLRPGAFIVSSQLHLYGIVHTNSGDWTANSIGYNKSMHTVTVFDLVRHPSAPSITLNSANWTGVATKIITLQCSIVY